MSNPGSLIGTLQTAAGDIDIIGYVVWWNVREVEASRDWFKASLDTVGLDGERYAREHNYRATFIRCLRSLEEQRIIRKVKEDSGRLVFQFTAEKLIDDDPENPHLEYTPETVIEIDKSAYFTEGNFADALIKCDAVLKPILVEMFDKERQTYRSGDLTRYIQRIFKDHADIVSLREQGSVYFVPASFGNLVSQVAQVLETCPKGTAQLEFFPVPDAESSRSMVGHGVESEIVAIFTKMDDEIKKMKAGNTDITEKWVDHRQKKIREMRERLTMYSEVLGDTAQRLTGKFDAMSAGLTPRVLEI
jgi:hypothetical protein